MKSRITITGQKTWKDSNNAALTRPQSVTITLLRNGEVYKTADIDSNGDGSYIFRCLPVCKEKYTYRVDEIDVPQGYFKTIEGYNIINTAEPGSITISGTITWDDNNNEDDTRPTSTMVNLFQNGILLKSEDFTTPPDDENISEYNFPDVPQFDSNGNLYVYTVTENEITGYRIIIDGLNITNTTIGFEFSFKKISSVSAMSLQGAAFELKKNGVIIGTSQSDDDGIIKFTDIKPGSYQMKESIPPVGYMNESEVYQVGVLKNGSATINGFPAEAFIIKNIPLISISGKKIWDDNDNPDNSRPYQIIVNLLRNGIQFKQISIPVGEEAETPIVFNDLPPYDESKTPYTYTINEAVVPEGYESSVDGLEIKNTIKSFTVIIKMIDFDTSKNLAIFRQLAYYGATLNLKAPHIDVYTALEPTTQNLTIYQDSECIFYYKKNES